MHQQIKIMAIEDDIQQAQFRNPYHKAVVNVLYTHNWLGAQQAEMFKSYDLTPQQYNVLRILRGQSPNPVTVNAIIERMLDKMSNASRLVDKLLAKDMVIRRECPHDRRAVDVVITQKGLDVLAQIDVLQKDWEASFTNLTEPEALELSSLLDKLRGCEP